MSEKAKKQVSLFYSILLIILAISFTVVSFLPVVVVNTSDMNYPEVFYNGRYTNNIDAPDEISFGMNTVLDFLTDFSDVVTVIGVQSLDSIIKVQQEHVDEIRYNESYSTTSIDRAIKKLADLKDKRDDILDELTDEDVSIIKDKLQYDEDFIDIIAAFYGLIGSIITDSADAESIIVAAGSDYDMGLDILPIIMLFMQLLSFLMLIGCALVFPIIIVIHCIVLAVKTFKHLNYADAAEIDKRMDKFPFTGYTSFMVILFVLYALTAPGASMGGAVIGAIVIFLIACLLRAVKTVLFADKSNIVPIVVKQAISAVSIVATAILLANFIGLNLIGELDQAVVPMTETQFFAEVDKYADSGMGVYSVMTAAKEEVLLSNVINAIVVAMLGLFGSIMIVAALGNSTERLANKKGKNARGALVEYKAMVALAVILLIFAIVPTVFAANSADALEEAYSKGQFKIWYNEHEERGTEAYTEYNLLIEYKEAAEEELIELEEELASADGDKAEELAEKVDDAKHTLKMINNEIKDIEAKPTRPVVCIVMAALFFVSELAYLLVPKFFFKKKDGEEIAPPVELM